MKGSPRERADNLRNSGGRGKEGRQDVGRRERISHLGDTHDVETSNVDRTPPVAPLAFVGDGVARRRATSLTYGQFVEDFMEPNVPVIIQVITTTRFHVWKGCRPSCI